MEPHDMTHDELEDFEEEIVHGSEKTKRDHKPPKEDEMLDITPSDEDGLPDDTAKYRVPS